jgi:hypothetical protein
VAGGKWLVASFSGLDRLDMVKVTLSLKGDDSPRVVARPTKISFNLVNPVNPVRSKRRIPCSSFTSMSM